MQVSQIVAAIASGAFTHDEINQLYTAVNFARHNLGKQNRSKIKKGDTVQWNSTRAGTVMSGVVIKVNIKNIIVDTGTGNWKVPAAMLTVV